MVLDLTLAAALAPTAVLFPLPTLPVHPVLWWFLFHPGAYNTSAIIKLYSEVLQLAEEDINAARGERHRVWAANGSATCRICAALCAAHDQDRERDGSRG